MNMNEKTRQDKAQKNKQGKKIKYLKKIKYIQIQKYKLQNSNSKSIFQNIESKLQNIYYYIREL